MLDLSNFMILYNLCFFLILTYINTSIKRKVLYFYMKSFNLIT